MAYLHINNLYKEIDILLFKECYALEKIDGTSSDIRWKDNKIAFKLGTGNYNNFVKLFDVENLEKKLKEDFFDRSVVINGEGYGGKIQHQSNMYGKELKFIVFDIRIDGMWLDVPNAEELTKSFGLEFVSYNKVSADIETLNKERDLPSTQAKRNGIEEDKQREGIVIRPLIELRKNNGERVIAKHKTEEFRETKTKREVDPERLKLLTESREIAEEWVTENRLDHVLSKLDNPTELNKIPDVIKSMIEDVYREGKDELVESKETRKVIGSKTVQLYKARISKI